MEARTILLVDDNADSLHIYSLMLEHHGMRVLRTRSPEEGFHLASSRLADAVVTELFMPPVAGRSLAELLKCDARTVSLPVIGITSVPVFTSHQAGLAACDAVLVKPCAPSRLLLEVQRVLGGGPSQISSPRSTVTAWPCSSTRSPAQRVRTTPPRADTW